MAHSSSRQLSVIVPALNEADFIEACIASIDLDDCLEVLIVDGGSTDGTREIVTRMSASNEKIRMIDNSAKRTAAAALNLGMESANGEYVARLDAHTTYSPGYLRALVTALEQTDATLVGGVWDVEPRANTLAGRAIAASISNPWVMGQAEFRTAGDQIVEVDAVPYGCWRLSDVLSVGGFNEELTRSQDFDLYSRLRQAGGKIMLVPEARITYFARSDVWETVKYTYWNGYWVGYPWARYGVRFSNRHFIPALAVLAGGILCATAMQRQSAAPLVPAVAYGAVLAGGAWHARDHGSDVALVTPAVATFTHALYGAGTLAGMAKGLVRRRRSGFN